MPTKKKSSVATNDRRRQSATDLCTQARRDGWTTADEAAGAIGCDSGTIYGWVKRGVVPSLELPTVTRDKRIVRGVWVDWEAVSTYAQKNLERNRAKARGIPSVAKKIGVSSDEEVDPHILQLRKEVRQQNEKFDQMMGLLTKIVERGPTNGTSVP